MKKAILLVVLVAIFAVALSGTALASVQSASGVSQAAMYAHIWGLGGTNYWVHQAQSGPWVPPSTPTPGGVVPPSPVFPQ
jgi:hypothetical protein